MSNILLPVDGSETCLRAVEYMIKRMQQLREPPTLYLLTIHPPIPYANVASAVGQEAITRFYREEGEAKLKSARDMLDAAQVKYSFHIIVGDPAEVIARFAAERGIDEIVMGTRGLGAVSNVLIGSVASKVIQLASVPVTLVK